MNCKSLFHKALAGALATSLLPAALSSTVSAQSAAQPFTTQIFIQNPNSAPATVVVNFYTESTGAQQAVSPSYNLNANGSTIVLVGSLNLSSPWRGSAVISSDQPVVAASMQVPPSGFGHIMANAFTADQASDSYFLTTFLRNVDNEVSVLAVQNTENQQINIGVRFVDLNGNTAAVDFATLPGYATKIYDAATSSTLPSNLPNPFNGSVVVTATKSGGQPALIVATSETKRVDNNPALNTRAYGFEAIPSSAGATTIYLPSALCRFGTGLQTTFFAIQNLSTSSTAVVTVTYAAGTNQPQPQTNNVAPFAKWSVNPCQSNGSQPYNGAAVVQSTQPVAAVIKAAQTDPLFPHSRFVTAHIAQGRGSRRVAFPYVRWSPSTPGNDFRTNIAIQNIGGSVIPAGQLVVRYYDPNGALVNTCTSIPAVAPGAKLNTNVAGAFFASDFNCTTVQPSNGASYSFTGSAVVEGPSGAQLLAVARTSPPGVSAFSIHTEDFNGIPLP